MAVHFTSMHSNTVWLTRARPTGDRWLATVTPIHWLLLSSPERSTVFEPNAQTTDCPSAQIQRVLCCNIAHSLVPEKKRMSVLETVNYCLQKKTLPLKLCHSDVTLMTSWYYFLCPGIKHWCCLTSVCLSAVAYIGPKSRTERLYRKNKISTQPTSHVTRTPLSSSKVKG